MRLECGSNCEDGRTEGVREGGSEGVSEHSQGTAGKYESDGGREILFTNWG